MKRETILWIISTILAFGPGLATAFSSNQAWLHVAVVSGWLGICLHSHAWRVRLDRLDRERVVGRIS